MSTASDGFAAIGMNTGFSTQSSIESFPFSSPFAVSVRGTIISTTPPVNPIIAYVAGVGSSTTGYITQSAESTNIWSFPFSTPFSGDAVVGQLAANRNFSRGVKSSTRGYIAGGSFPPGTVINTITSFPFSTPFATTTNGGALSPSNGFRGAAGLQSNTDGYFNGGLSGPTSVNIIQRFPFSTPFATASDIGDLSLARHAASTAQS
jgi:hypothetical protein